MQEKEKLHLADTHTTFTVHQVRWVTQDGKEPFWSLVIDIGGKMRQTTFGSQEGRDIIINALQSATQQEPVTGVALMSVDTKQGKAYVFVFGDTTEDTNHAALEG